MLNVSMKLEADITWNLSPDGDCAGKIQDRCKLLFFFVCLFVFLSHLFFLFVLQTGGVSPAQMKSIHTVYGVIPWPFQTENR